MSPSHLINSKKMALNTEPHWFLVHNSFVPFASCLVEVLHVFGCSCTESWNIFDFLYYRTICKIVLAQWSHCISTPSSEVFEWLQYWAAKWKNKVSWWLWHMWELVSSLQAIANFVIEP
jgi:hypothetical protein